MKDNLLTKKQKFLKHNGKGQEGGKDKEYPRIPPRKIISHKRRQHEREKGKKNV